MNRQPSTAATFVYLALFVAALAVTCWLADAFTTLVEHVVVAPQPVSVDAR